MRIIRARLSVRPRDRDSVSMWMVVGAGVVLLKLGVSCWAEGQREQDLGF